MRRDVESRKGRAMNLMRARCRSLRCSCTPHDAALALVAAGTVLLAVACGGDETEATSPEATPVAAAEADLALPDGASEIPAEPLELPLAVIDRALLQPVELRYAVRFEMGGQAVTGTSRRSVRRERQGERGVWQVSTETDLGGGSTDRFVMDADTLAPLSREASDGRSRLVLAFTESAVEGSLSLAGEDTPISVQLESPVMADTSALEWLMTAWPLAPDYAAIARTFDASSRSVQAWSFGVTGSESVTVPAGTFDAYKVQMLPTDGKPGIATLWFAKDPPRHLLRSETVLPAAAVRTELVSVTGS
jgi:hypothetical protein